MSMIKRQTDVRLKVLRHTPHRKIPIEIRKKRRSLLYNHIAVYNGSDNPNKEQKFMVDTFIKSSNGLFKSEMEVSGAKATGLEDRVWAYYPSRLGLYKSGFENSAKLDMDTSQDKVVHTGRMKRYLSPDSVVSIRPLDHIRGGHGTRRCDRYTNRMCPPKERILRSGQRNLMGGLYTDDLRILPKFKRRLRSTSGGGRQYRYNRRYLNTKINRFKNSVQGNDLGEDNANKKMFVLFNSDSDLKNPQSSAKKERRKFRNKFFRMRRNDGECGNPLKRSRCTKPIPTVIKQSVNFGRTGRICFPSTHRCMVMRTCPCSVEYRKCPPRTTCCLSPETLCFEKSETHPTSTIGRCLGVDTETPTPLEEGLCMMSPNPGKMKKRCACDCGCGCPHNLRRGHPDRALARGRCGCGCGCGCLHAGHCPTRKDST